MTSKQMQRRDLEFCAECGALLPMPDPKRGYVVCGTCMHKWISDDVINELQTVQTYKFERPMAIDNEADANQSAAGPTVNRKCTKCGNDTMTYATRQTRSADEGMTVFFTCTQCGHKDIEYT